LIEMQNTHLRLVMTNHLTPVQKFLGERRVELESQYTGTDAEEVFKVGWSYLAEKVSKLYMEVTPEAARNIEVLESILVSFIENGADGDMLNNFEIEMEKMKH